MSTVRLIPAPASRRRREMGPGGFLIAAVIGALFFVDAVRAAPAAGVQLALSESPDLQVTLTVEAAQAPTFQVYRQAGGGGLQWVVELPGSVVDNAALVSSGPGVLLHEAHAEAGKKGGASRVILTFADDVDFDADAHKGTLAVRFHHTGDPAALRTAHRSWVVTRDAQVAAQAKAAANTEAAARARAADADAVRLAATARDAERAAQAERARVAAVDAEQARVAAIAAAAADKARADAERARIADAEKVRVAAIEAERSRVAAEDKAARDREERARLEVEAKKMAEAARLEAEAKQVAETRRRAEVARLETEARAAEARAAEARAAEARAAEQRAAEQRRLVDEARLKKIEAERRQAAEVERLEKIEAERRQAEARRLQEEAARQAEFKKAAEAKRGLEREQQAEAARQAALQDAARQRAEADAAQRVDDQRRQQALRDADEARARAQADETRARQAAEARRQAAVTHDEPGFGGATAAQASSRTTATAATTATTTRTETAPIPSRLARAEPPPPRDDFGGGRSVEFSRGGARYERTDLPRDRSDDFGYADDGDVDESVGRSVLSLVTVKRTGDGARVGIRVDGGARYHVARRGRDQLVLTLIDTRAQNLEVRRVLDARSMGGPVLRVLPSVDEDRHFRIELVIETRGQVPVKIQQDGQMLWLEVIG